MHQATFVHCIGGIGACCYITDGIPAASYQSWSHLVHQRWLNHCYPACCHLWLRCPDPDHDSAILNRIAGLGHFQVGFTCNRTNINRIASFYCSRI